MNQTKNLMFTRPQRRRALGALLVLTASAFAPLRVLAAAWNKAAFAAKSVNDGLKAIGAVGHTESDLVELKAPEIAENGAIVPIEVISRVPRTQSVYLLAEKNQYPLAAGFDFLNGAEPFVSTRIKMNESARLTAVVKADGKFYSATREVKVTIGGCGA
ncbi:MAG: thiosulfate oxidation carrier protein SoxY [Gammaproteobacteria bacterium]